MMIYYYHYKFYDKMWKESHVIIIIITINILQHHGCTEQCLGNSLHLVNSNLNCCSGHMAMTGRVYSATWHVKWFSHRRIKITSL